MLGRHLQQSQALLKEVRWPDPQDPRVDLAHSTRRHAVLSVDPSFCTSQGCTKVEVQRRVRYIPSWRQSLATSPNTSAISTTRLALACVRNQASGSRTQYDSKWISDINVIRAATVQRTTHAKGERQLRSLTWSPTLGTSNLQVNVECCRLGCRF